MTRNAKFNLMACLLLVLSGSAVASDCDLNVSQPQTDFGSFNRGTLSQAANGTQTNIIGKKMLMVTVTCPRPERITLFYRAASGGAREGYSMGDIAHVTLVASDAQADGKAIDLAYQQQGGSAPAGNNKTLGMLLNIGLTPASAEPVTQMTMQLTSVAVLNDIHQHVKDRQTLNGNGTLEVVSE